MKSILDPTFKYRTSSSHGDVNNFAKRQAARLRIAQSKAKASKKTEVVQLRKAAK